jgi:hypothetical protein
LKKKQQNTMNTSKMLKQNKQLKPIKTKNKFKNNF